MTELLTVFVNGCLVIAYGCLGLAAAGLILMLSLITWDHPNDDALSTLVAGPYVLLLVAGIAIVLWLARERLRRARERDAERRAQESMSMPPSLVERHLARATWTRAFEAALRESANSLPEAGGSRALLAAALGTAQLVDDGFALVERAVRNGSTSSLVVVSESAARYLVVFPATQDHPRQLARHAGYRHGLRRHLAELRDSLRAEAGVERVLWIALFLRADGGEGVIRLGYVDERALLLPRGLLRAAEQRAADVHSHEQRDLFVSEAAR